MKESIKKRLRPLAFRLQNSGLAKPLWYAQDALFVIRYHLMGRPHISAEDIRNVETNVTFIFKSFNRQRQARRLCRAIRRYYPNVRIVIADDSRESLVIDGAEIIHLPFNSGLSKGLIAALERVETPFVMRMDDDLLLTPKSDVHGQLLFLQRHPEVDLAAIQMDARSEKAAENYRKIVMKKKLLIPAGTVMEGRDVVYKAPNVFLARTEKLRMVGYDPNIRMIDHHEFFYRAAGQIVCVQDPHAGVLHCHNRFDREYNLFRNDIEGDQAYLQDKYKAKDGIIAIDPPANVT